MLASKIAEKYTIEELIEKMAEQGYKHKDFAPDPDNKRYRSWYFRNRKRMEISGVWHLDNPKIFFYKPLGQTSLLKAAEK